MKASHLRGELAKSSGDAFCNLLQAYLDAVLPSTATTRRLGELDRQGIDIIQYNDPSLSASKAIQCKGYERPFHSSELPKLQKEIDKFTQLGPVVDEYWLVLNRAIERLEDRQKIEAWLHQLVSKGRAATAKLLDLEGILVTLGDLAASQIAEWSTAAQKKLREDYRARLEVVRYINDVPYVSESTGRNPARLLSATTQAYLAKLGPDTTGKNRSPPRYLLTGGFGFGKTSTLHALAAEWLQLGKRIIYTPAALLDEEAFTNAAGLASELLRLIHPEDKDLTDPELRLFKTLLKKEIARSNDWLLIIDGLDESPYWEKPGHLAALWGSLSDLGLPFVTSMRDELFQLRRTDFEGRGVRYRGQFLKVINLLDWPDELILEFLKRFEAARAGPTPPAFTDLTALVRNGAYEQHYGDIPKRPLFLGMLAEDAWLEKDPEQKLHRLYGKYLRRKIEGDRWSAGAFGKVVRQGRLAEQFGFDESTERMIRAMQNVAGNLLEGDKGNVPAEGYSVFDEEVLEQCIASEGGVGARAEEVVLNSVVQPAGRNPLTGRRQFRFAHKSFQEWFAARHLVSCSVSLARIGKENEAVWKFAAGMAADQAVGRDLP
ncbi:MAG: NACHT domain-containing protein [Allosphingosinicella sp.]